MYTRKRTRQQVLSALNGAVLLHNPQLPDLLPQVPAMAGQDVCPTSTLLLSRPTRMERAAASLIVAGPFPLCNSASLVLSLSSRCDSRIRTPAAVLLAGVPRLLSVVILMLSTLLLLRRPPRHRLHLSGGWRTRTGNRLHLPCHPLAGLPPVAATAPTACRRIVPPTALALTADLFTTTACHHRSRPIHSSKPQLGRRHTTDTIPRCLLREHPRMVHLTPRLWSRVLLSEWRIAPPPSDPSACENGRKSRRRRSRPTKRTVFAWTTCTTAGHPLLLAITAGTRRKPGVRMSRDDPKNPEGLRRRLATRMMATIHQRLRTTLKTTLWAPATSPQCKAQHLLQVLLMRRPQQQQLLRKSALRL
jgi:hypothetical protein